MKKDNALAIGVEDEKGAYIIEDTTRDATIENALQSMLIDGLSLEDAAKAANLNPHTLRGMIGRNTDYNLAYARIKVCRYIDMMERLIGFVDNLPDSEEDWNRAKEFKLTKQFDAYKFAIGKYEANIGQAVNESGLTVNVNAEEGSRIVIQTASDVPSEPKESAKGEEKNDSAIDV
jgi:hypothetical protein